MTTIAGNNNIAPETEPDAPEEPKTQLQDKFLFGLIDMPRFPGFHIISFMVIGAVFFVIQVFRAVDPVLMKNAVEKHTPAPEAASDILLFPTIICVILAYSMYRTRTIRRMVIAVKENAQMQGFGISTRDAEEVVMTIRSSWLAIILQCLTILVFALAEFLISMQIIHIYIKYFV